MNQYDRCFSKEEGPAVLGNIRAVIFDLDGTLLDTENLFIRAWEEADGRPSAGLREALESMIGLSRPAAEAVLYQYMGADYPYPEIRRQVDKVFTKARQEGRLPLKPYARKIISRLSRAGFKLGLATSTISDLVLAELEALKLLDYFDAVVCGDQVENSKPAPDIFLRAASLLGEAPEDCLVIEDSYNGIRGAWAAGMGAVMVPDIKKPTEEMRRLSLKICRDLKEAEEMIFSLRAAPGRR